jgi:hypothetical protein
LGLGTVFLFHTYIFNTYTNLIFMYLVVNSLAATRDRRIHIIKLFVFPCLFLFLSFFKLVHMYTVKLWCIFWVSITIGCLFAFIFISKRQIIKAEKFHITMKGSYNTLVLSMLIFFTKYFFSYMKAIDQYLDYYLFLETAIYSLSMGISIGMLLLRLREFRKGNH